MATRARRTATMADIARVSGVSITTVSHVVNKTRPVRQETEAAVWSAIGQVGYRPAVANGAPESRILGLASSAFSNPSFNDLIHGIEQTATALGYSLLVADTRDDTSVELRAVTELVSHRVRAILLAPSPDPAAALSYAKGQGVPVVLLDRMIDAEFDQVGSENIESTGLLVDHLAQIGHTRVAMISGMPGLSTTNERVEGFRRAAARNGLRLGRNSIVTGFGSDHAAQQTFVKIMSAARPPSALVMGNNRSTLGAMRGARQLGIDIPKDVALVGYDDFEWADLFHPRLTVIAQPTLQMGEHAVDLAMSRIAGPERAARKLTLATTFIHRESCGCQPEPE